MERPTWAPQGIDLSVPSVSRIYDYYLGGSHNFEVDREAGRRAIEAFPGLPKIMQANRAFMRRAVRYAVDRGVTQFLDIGSGIPTFGNVHEVAQAAHPRARVVYVDHDPVAVAHSRAVLAGDERAAIVSADLRSPHDILAADEVAGLLDLDRPVALLLVAVLHFMQDGDDPWKAVAQLREALAPGSLLILTHASTDTGPIKPEEGEELEGVYRNVGSPLLMRSRPEVERFFDGFEMVEPGLVPMPTWRPDAAPTAAVDDDPAMYVGFAGVGRKP
ncbi:SAM-dependent methyltransferase [Streptomyces sp. ISL-11]|uniref:SAM-dependent methyltransferase n=1 Tax=Streptomyces sp. ISL-11 TaxID=2819174 RepID=UPI001BEA4CA6|nr:SAM-dependent methyltransferase [Streptomyces sp. ISL-11]MBT2386392.1 SAM-dependent methyltransferase [Streptomyces sp. ISL-11]